MENSVYTILRYYATFSFDPYLFMLAFIASTGRVVAVIWNFVLLGMRSSSCRGNSCFLPRRRPLDRDCYFR